MYLNEPLYFHGLKLCNERKTLLVYSLRAITHTYYSVNKQRIHQPITYSVNITHRVIYFTNITINNPENEATFSRIHQ